MSSMILISLATIFWLRVFSGAAVTVPELTPFSPDHVTDQDLQESTDTTAYSSCIKSLAFFNNNVVKLHSPTDCVTLWEGIGCAGSSVNVIGEKNLTDVTINGTRSISSCTFLDKTSWAENRIQGPEASTVNKDAAVKRSPFVENDIVAQEEDASVEEDTPIEPIPETEAADDPASIGSAASSSLQKWPYPIPNPPPSTWQEHWFSHHQKLDRVFYNNDIAVYYDSTVKRTVKWPFTYVNDAWRYTKRVYGALGPDARLYAVFHAGPWPFSHAVAFNDAAHGHRNVIDNVVDSKNGWTKGEGNNLDIITHEMCHIVEAASHKIIGLPAYELWSDSKWAEIFIYDVYRGLKRTADVNRWYSHLQNNSDDFPRKSPRSFWFRDFFYPLYKKYGQTKVLQNYFTTLARNFPTDTSEKYWVKYTRRMNNYGEFVHFWSGAAGSSVKTLFKSAFGWPAQWERDFKQAQKDFPRIKYSNMST